MKHQYKRALASFIENRKYKVEVKDMQGNTAESKTLKQLYGTQQG